MSASVQINCPKMEFRALPPLSPRGLARAAAKISHFTLQRATERFNDKKSCEGIFLERLQSLLGNFQVDGKRV